MKIYIVVGSTGEYGDYNQWNVAAYTDKESAEIHVKLSNDWVKTNCTREEISNQWGKKQHWRAPKLLKNPWDNGMRMDYTGTEYLVEEVELFRHPDEFLEKQP